MPVAQYFQVHLKSSLLDHHGSKLSIIIYLVVPNSAGIPLLNKTSRIFIDKICTRGEAVTQ
jgi:hypothetical protein